MTPTKEFLENLKQVPQHLRESMLRNGKSPETDRERSQSTFHNLFLHMQSVRVHRHSLRFAYTFGLGLILTASFVVLTLTGILLMVYYKPAAELAYDSVKDIHFVVPAGRFIRNIHRWSAHLLVLAVFLHMARVFYTGSYKRPREFNWLVGLMIRSRGSGSQLNGCRPERLKRTRSTTFSMSLRRSRKYSSSSDS